MSVAELPTYRPLSLSLHYRNEHHCWLDGKGRGNGRRPAVYILSISLLRGRTNPLQLQPPRSVLWIDLSVRPPALSSSSPSLDCGRKMTSPSVDPVPSFAPSLALPTDGGSPRRQLRRPRPGVPPARLGHFPASHAGPSLPCVPLTGQHRGHSQRRQRRQRSLIGNGGWAMLGPRPSPPSCSSSFFQPGRDGSERGAREREMDERRLYRRIAFANEEA